MPVPPRRDPRRPLHLAARSCRVLGGLALLGGTCALTSLFAGGRGTPRLIGAVASLATCGGVGVAYFVFAHYMKRRQTWAVIAALSLTGVAFLYTAGSAAAMVVMVLSGAFASIPGGRGFARIMWGVTAFYGLIAVALGQLVYWLARSFPALKMPPAVDEDRGFDVLPLPAAVPVASASVASASVASASVASASVASASADATGPR